MLKRLIAHAVVGVGLAFVITNITMFIFLRNVTGEQAILSYIIWMCAGVLYGIISLIHDTSISKIAAAAIHYVVNLAISCGAFLLMYNAVLHRTMEFSLLWPIGVFTLVYIIVGLCNYMYDKMSVNALNRKLGNKE